MKKIVIYILSILTLSLAFTFFYLKESKAEETPQILTEEEQIGIS